MSLLFVFFASWNCQQSVHPDKDGKTSRIPRKSIHWKNQQIIIDILRAEAVGHRQVNRMYKPNKQLAYAIWNARMNDWMLSDGQKANNFPGFFSDEIGCARVLVHEWQFNAVTQLRNYNKNEFLIYNDWKGTDITKYYSVSIRWFDDEYRIFNSIPVYPCGWETAQQSPNVPRKWNDVCVSWTLWGEKKKWWRNEWSK